MDTKGYISEKQAIKLLNTSVARIRLPEFQEYLDTIVIDERTKYLLDSVNQLIEDRSNWFKDYLTAAQCNELFGFQARQLLQRYSVTRIEIPVIYSVSTNKYCYIKSQVMDVYNKENVCDEYVNDFITNRKNYISEPQAVTLLGTSTARIRLPEFQEYLKPIIINGKKKYLLNSVNQLIADRSNWFKDYLTIAQCDKLFGFHTYDLLEKYSVSRVKIPVIYNTYNNKSCYIKRQVIDVYNKESECNKYISQSAAVKLLNTGATTFRKLKIWELLEYKIEKSEKLYTLESVNELARKKDKWNMEYINLKSCCNILMCKSSSAMRKTLKEAGIEEHSSPYRLTNVNSNTFYNKSEILEFKKKYTTIEEDKSYLLATQAADYLGISYQLFTSSEYNSLLDYKLYRGDKVYNIKQLDKLKKKKDEWYKNHINLDEASKLLNVNKDAIRNSVKNAQIPSINVPTLYLNTAYNILYYSKSDILNLQKELDNFSKFIPKKTAVSYLNISERNFDSEGFQKYLPTVKKRGKTKYYLKSEVEELYHLRNEWFETNILLTDVSREYIETLRNEICKDSPGIRQVSIPTYAIRGNCKVAFNKEELNYFLENDRRFIKQKLNSIVDSTDYETFKSKTNLLIKNMHNINTSSYTLRKWFEYAESRINKSKEKSLKTRNTVINRLAYNSEDLGILLDSYSLPEIYCATTNQINQWLLSITSKDRRSMIYYFLENVDKDIKMAQHPDGDSLITSNIKGFNFKEIYKYDDPIFKASFKRTVDKDIYTLDEYLDVFEYLIDIPFHVKKGLNYNYLENQSVQYWSIWLYSLLHLNNGWRHGDVTNFPRLFLKDLLEEWEITSLDWFLNNTISIARSRRIISRITQYDYRISKTEFYGHFFCSDRLAPVVATVLMLLEFYYDNSYINPPNEDEPVMIFNNDYNAPSETFLSDFFSDFRGDKFIFKSRKMNKTVLTLVYNVSRALCPSGYDAMLLPQWMRVHIEQQSTLHYVKFTQEDLDLLSHELFVRGEFGYIADSLLNLISTSDKFTNRTKEIASIKENIGDIQKIEAIISMLNRYDDERKAIYNMIRESSLDTCINNLSKIYMGNLPGKQPDIQCLFSEFGCRYTEKKCENCKFKIPTIYALRTICFSLKKEMKEYLSTTSISKRIHLSDNIHRKVDTLMEAIDKFGTEYVYNCMDISEDDFIDMFDEIEEPCDLIRLT